ncbi:RNA polymerase sigma factor [Chitinophagaceae bacterium LB-8]|uniref:RNA polymerase sigma factor n=1 Tax=Paraflavisolibacter caeni TaxID=2982496 RepID=A0A9X3B8A9_9BACT|nr:RNA polymerase sigma factor [Paraflavisolibacter caeni]MCU7549471.1 RNA polymerase sigma factor [Paraflavisolibacter caeni]
MEDLHAIIKGCTGNDHKHQKMLYERFYGYALKIVFRYIYHYDKAVDVVNDGFVKLFHNFHKFESRDGAQTEKLLMGWLKRIMVNTAIDELRRRHMLPEIGDLPDHIWQIADNNLAADQKVLYKELIEHVKKLPPSYRAVFNMYVIDGFSHQEIANALGISVGACKSNLSKARAHLKQYLKKDEESTEICNL